MQLLWTLLVLGCIPALTALPHVRDCNYCSLCHYDESGGLQPLPSSPAVSSQEAATNIVPTAEGWADKQSKPNCTECWGCSTQLQPLKAILAFGHNFSVEAGASPEWLFFADLPDTHITGRKAIVKVWCLPFDKVTGRYRGVKCEGVDFAIRGAQHLVALDELTQDCGLHDITIKTWLAPVNAVVPGLGLHIFWYGLWMERAPGMSMNQLAYVGRRDLVEHLVLNLLQAKLNKTQVVRAAVFDLLTSQCDRHAQNVFIDEQGQLKLIDNLNSLRFSWVWCSQDSIFLPGTQKYEIVRYGGSTVNKRVGARMRRSINPMVVLDYRCYVPDGEIGTQHLPEDVKQCLTRLSQMGAEAVKSKYGFADTQAGILVTRATDIVNKGFEWALKKGEPKNLPPLRYKWHAPCCNLSFTRRRGVECGHPWSVRIELPYGDASKGQKWQHSYPDPGTFDGAALWDELQ